MSQDPTVWIVEDDEALRTSLVWLLESAGRNVEAYASPGEFLNNFDADRRGVLVVDLQLPDMSGLELVRTLREQNRQRPFIMISGHGDISSAVELMREGAIDFMEKPFDQSRLLQRIEMALQCDAESHERYRKGIEIREQIDSLTPRELEVMHMVADGQLTKQIAKRLGISEKTVEVHRSHVTKKLRVRSIAHLVRIVLSLGAADAT